MSLSTTVLKDRSKNGVATLPTILLLGGVIIEITIALAFLSYYFNAINQSSRFAAEALQTARAGADDAILRVIRDKNFSSPSGYQVSSGSRTATVLVCKDILCDSSSSPGKTEILSTAAVLNRSRRIRVVLSVNASTGLVSVDSFQEVSL